MKLKNLSIEELEMMPLDDIAYIVLKEKNKKMKVIELYKVITDALGYNEREFDSHLADFFSLLATDKRFIQIEKGFWDLTENHTSKIKLEEIVEAAEEDDALLENEEKEEEFDIDQEESDDYYDNSIDTDDDDDDDDLQGLVIIDEDAEEHEM